MDPISLIIVAVMGLFTGAATAAVVSIGYLTLNEVMTWFQARRHRLVNRHAVATTVVDLLANGRYRTVQGVFNTWTRTWDESRTIDSHRLSPDLARLHRYHRAVTYRV